MNYEKIFIFPKLSIINNSKLGVLFNIYIESQKKKKGSLDATYNTIHIVKDRIP